MKFFQKKRVEIRLVVNEDGKGNSNVTGKTSDVVDALMYLLCSVCIEDRKDDTRRGELREAITKTVGEYFDEVWKRKVLEEGVRE